MKIVERKNPFIEGKQYEILLFTPPDEQERTPVLNRAVILENASHVNLELRTSLFDFAELDEIKQAIVTAQRIQQMLAAGEPIIIRDGQLIDLALTELQWWFLGVIANNEIFNPETSESTSTNDAHFHMQNFEHHLGFASLSYYWIRHNALYPLTDAGLIEAEDNCHYLTDFGWQVLKAGR